MDQVNDWDEYTFTEEQIKNEDYKATIGGGKEQWDKRGMYQLLCMAHFGMTPEHTFIDIGCGPLRAGDYFIRYLEKENYTGYEYNRDYTVIAKRIIEANNQLKSKNPTIYHTVSNMFEFSIGFPTFDYGLAFSVLNHCTDEQRIAFFNNIKSITHPGSRIFFSHGFWLTDELKEQIPDIWAVFRYEENHPSISTESFGWKPHEIIYPFIEFERMN